VAGEIASAFVRIRPNMTGFRSETQAGVESSIAGNQAGFASIGKKIAATVGIALGATAGYQIVKSAVSSAEAVQKTTEVIKNQYGSASKQVLAFANNQGVALGSLGENTLKTSAKLSFLFKSLGFGTTEAAKQTVGWEKLALAMNAAQGGGPQGAVALLQKIPQATRGSARSLLQLGLSFSQAQIQAYEFAHGAIPSITTALTPAQKAAGSFALAMQQLPQRLALAQAHSGDLANVTARLSAEWAKAKEHLGTALLPVLVTLANAMSRSVGPAVTSIIAVFKDLKVVVVGLAGLLKPIWEPIISGIRKVREAFSGPGGIGGTIDRLRTDFSKLSPAAKIAVVAIGGIAASLASLAVVSFPITAVIALGVAFGEAYRRSASFRAIISTIGNFLQDKIEPPVRRVADAIRTGLGSAFAFVGSHKRVFEILAVALVSPIAAIGVLLNHFGLLRPILSRLGGLFSAVGRALVYAFHAAQPTITQLGVTIKAVFQDIVTVAKPALELIIGVFVVGVRVLETIWRHFGGTIIAYMKGVLGVLLGTIRGGLQVIRGIIDIFTGLFTGDWRKAWNGLKEIVGGVLTGITSVFKAWAGVIRAFFTDLWHTIEKVTLEGINKIVGLLAKIPTSFSLFGQTIGFKNPFAKWHDDLSATIDGIGKSAPKKLADVGAASAKAIGDAMKKGTTAPATTDAAKKGGADLGKTYAKSATDAIQQSAPALTQTLNNTLQTAIQAANKKIADTVTAAKNNLDKIGQDLAKTIDTIQQKIGGAAGAIAGSPQGAAFEKLKKLIESGAPAFEIAKAQAELSGQLQNTGKTQQTVVQGQLSKLTDALNRGKISDKQFNERLHEILRKDGITMGDALKAGGAAFRDTFRNEVAALRAQAHAISQIPAKFRGIGGAGEAQALKIIHPLEVIRQEQTKVAIAASKQREAQLKQQQAIAKASAKSAAYTQQMATIGVHVRGPAPGTSTNVQKFLGPHAAPGVVKVPGAPTIPGAGPRVPRVTPAHVQSAASAIVTGLRNVCADVIQADKDIVAAIHGTQTPMENLRRTEVRIADRAEKQRQEMIREGRTTNNLLRRLERHPRGPTPGFGKEPKGVGSHHARKNAAAGVKA
jgi:hypothetical protein